MNLTETFSHTQIYVLHLNNMQACERRCFALVFAFDEVFVIVERKTTAHVFAIKFI